jgi:glyoxylase I family protein
MPGPVDHVNIVVTDLDRSVAFYTDLLGFRETRRATLEGGWIDAVAGLDGVRARVVYVQPPGDGPRIELIQYDMPPGALIPENARANTVGLRHIAFRTDDLGEAVRRLELAGVTFLGSPQTVPDGVVRHDAGRKTLVYFHDPDGVILELAGYGHSAGLPE